MRVVRIELTTSVLSGQRSTTELHAPAKLLTKNTITKRARRKCRALELPQRNREGDREQDYFDCLANGCLLSSFSFVNATRTLRQ